MNKPSKKTEWDWEEKFDLMLSEYCSWELEGEDEGISVENRLFRREEMHKFIRSLLHQRDNEIREWANYSRCHDNTKGTPEFGYNACLDDLLTYLSNREV